MPRLRTSLSTSFNRSNLSLADEVTSDLPAHLLHSRSTSTMTHVTHSLPEDNIRARAESAGPMLDVVPIQMKAKMYKAIKAGEYSMVWALLSKGASPNECDDPTGSGWTPLHWAAKDGHVGICQLLVSKGADVNSVDKSAQTPLHRAAYWGRLQVVDFLVYVGASIHAVDSKNQTPVEVALQRNNEEVYAYLKQQKQAATTKKPRTLRRHFEELLRDQAKEDKLLKKNIKLEDKIGKVAREVSKLQMLHEEMQKRGKVVSKPQQQKLEKLEERLGELRAEQRKTFIEVTTSRSETFEKHAQEQKTQTWMAFIDEL